MNNSIHVIWYAQIQLCIYRLSCQIVATLLKWMVLIINAFDFNAFEHICVCYKLLWD